MAGRGSPLPAIILTLAASSLVMAFFCWLSPREADDIIYAAGLSMPSLAATGQSASAAVPPSSLGELLRLQWQEYLQWNGRFVGQFLARCLLLAPDWLHAVLTPLVHASLLFSSLILLWGKRWREKLTPWHIVLLAGLLWFMLPAFGSAFFWRTGTANYGYTLLLAVLFLLPYRFWLDGSLSRLPGGAAFLLAGLPAGWSNESLGMLLVLLALGACVSQQRTGRHLQLWAVAGLAGAVAGWLALIAAPGNMARAAALGTGLVPLASWKAFHSFLIFWGTQQLELLPLYLLDLGALAFLHHRRELSREIWLPALLLFLMGHACIAAFVLSPSRADRAMTAGYFWLVLSTCALLFRLPLPRSFRITARLVFLLLFVSSLWQQAQVFRQAAPLVAARNEAVRKDILDVRYLDYPGSDKYFYPSYHTRDAILMDPVQDWGRLVPWQDARPLPGMPGIRAFTTSHMLYLDGVDDSPIHLACHTHEQTIASLLREVMLHTAPPPVAPRGANALNAWFKPAVTRGRDGKALLHLQGLRRLEDIAYIGREDACGQVVWHRLDWRSGNSSRP
ncbi:DUF6056 family protein [Desulfovibrio piger]|uniref:DUF6056 family protein n=1 Tax=Desulfovibrio piger TaxID=901 RepID=UPI0039F4EB69